MEGMLNYFVPEDGDSLDHLNVVPLPRGVDQLRLQHVKKVSPLAFPGAGRRQKTHCEPDWRAAGVPAAWRLPLPLQDGVRGHLRSVIRGFVPVRRLADAAAARSVAGRRERRRRRSRLQRARHQQDRARATACRRWRCCDRSIGGAGGVAGCANARTGQGPSGADAGPD